jgi:hypothetical protein
VAQTKKALRSGDMPRPESMCRSEPALQSVFRVDGICDRKARGAKIWRVSIRFQAPQHSLGGLVRQTRRSQRKADER